MSRTNRRLRELREQRNLSQDQLAKRVGGARSYITKIEQGRRTLSVEVRWVPLAPQESQARSALLRRLLIVGAQRLAQAEGSALKPAGRNNEGGQAGE